MLIIVPTVKNKASILLSHMTKKSKCHYSKAETWEEEVAVELKV